ncbi:hypothetical protein [Nitrospira moscoviensis]|uniref:Uncharacterized protein n=1 Tax=Nitrospira moscoviensis TaxID=42253 RepID=A0A0K2GBY9_NITMO|nr:hypothetical protein [Nitrospira moscoviensis]ALA58127.1 exported protein of unknown function [Nitrospira moscoviensis]
MHQMMWRSRASALSFPDRILFTLLACLSCLLTGATDNRPPLHTDAQLERPLEERPQISGLDNTPEGGMLPDGPVPGGTLPGGTLPGGTVPGGTLPGGTLPGGTVPGGTVPGGTLPGGTVPGGTLPDGTLPGGTLP